MPRLYSIVEVAEKMREIRKKRYAVEDSDVKEKESCAAEIKKKFGASENEYA